MVMELGHSFDTLDELAQLLLTLEHFDDIGIDNPLFYEDTQPMLVGDAKKLLDEVLVALKA